MQGLDDHPPERQVLRSGRYKRLEARYAYEHHECRHMHLEQTCIPTFRSMAMSEAAECHLLSKEAPDTSIVPSQWLIERPVHQAISMMRYLMLR